MPAFEVCQKHMRLKSAFQWVEMTREYFRKLLEAKMTVLYVHCDYCEEEEREMWPLPLPLFQ